MAPWRVRKEVNAGRSIQKGVITSGPPPGLIAEGVFLFALIVTLTTGFIALSGRPSKIIWFSGIWPLNWTMFFTAGNLQSDPCPDGLT